MMDATEAQQVRDGIADTIASIDAGRFDATVVQRAFLAGVIAAIEVDR
jgi:hypothetical protein